MNKEQKGLIKTILVDRFKNPKGLSREEYRILKSIIEKLSKED